MTVSFQPPVRQHHPADVYHRAWQLLEERDPRQAIALLDPAIAAEPGSTGLRTLRAWAYFQSAQHQRAEQELSGLVDDCPTDLWARYALGRVLERESKYADALPHMRLVTWTWSSRTSPSQRSRVAGQGRSLCSRAGPAGIARGRGTRRTDRSNTRRNPGVWCRVDRGGGASRRGHPSGRETRRPGPHAGREPEGGEG